VTSSEFKSRLVFEIKFIKSSLIRTSLLFEREISLPDEYCQPSASRKAIKAFSILIRSNAHCMLLA
jgi:hypothetical protein